MMENPEPLIKRRKVEEENVNHSNKLPNWIIGIIVRKLSLTERLRCERVDRKWKKSMREFGWTEQRKLDYETIFEGAERVREEEFTNKSLVALFKRIGKNLIELDLYSFFPEDVSVTPYICGSLPLLPNLARIDIMEIDLGEALQFFPETLLEICSSGPFNEATLSALAKNCPQLEAIQFIHGEMVEITEVSCMNDFLLNYPHLKKLIIGCPFLEETGKLTAIGDLKELEEFNLRAVSDVAFDEATFEAMVEGCKSLRRLKMYPVFPVSEEAFRGLANLSNLVELVLPFGHPNITDKVVKAISMCRDLKKVHIDGCQKITDDSIVSLVERCKSLVTLVVRNCPLVTDKSLDAVMAEVKKRHGMPPRALPEGPIDSGIVLFACEGTAIDGQKARDLNEENRWIIIEYTVELIESTVELYHRSF